MRLLDSVRRIGKDIFEEIENNYRETTFFRDPQVKIAEEIEVLYGRGDISRDQYEKLKLRLAKSQLGMGNLMILKRESSRKHELEKGGIPVEGDPHLEKLYKRHYRDKARLEDRQIEAESTLRGLAENLERVNESIKHAEEMARSALPDEEEARFYLEIKQNMQERSERLEERIRALAHSIRRIKALRNEMDSFEAELRILASDVQLSDIEASIRESMIY